MKDTTSRAVTRVEGPVEWGIPQQCHRGGQIRNFLVGYDVIVIMP